MLLSLSWLREFTPYEGSAESLGDTLTMLGLELEDIRRPYSQIADIVVGHVLECTMHPDSDHLHCCKVDVGQSEILEIVCGAPNVAAGQKVPVALVGTKMPNGMVIKKAKLRGVPSVGMICSESELGLCDDHSGIMVLPDNFIIGKKLVDELDLDHEILDISITPNRADCLSVLGLARETALAYNLPLNIPKINLSTIDDKDAKVEIKIEDEDLCWLYSGRVIKNVKVNPSPSKIKYRLQACGIRSISNVVDITNYILLELGQPLHAFDLDKLVSKKIIVRKSGKVQNFKTLDNQERQLLEQDLCICDEKCIIALAGVMGGADTEMSLESRNVFLESAVFRPQNIRKTSRRLGLSSESSYRFERGIDQNLTLFALDRAAYLMSEFSGGSVVSDIYKAEPKPFTPAIIKFVPDNVSKLLGVDIDKDMMSKTLLGLGCKVDKKDSEWQVAQPSWRPDLTREADIIEEVGRVYGLDHIEPELPSIKRRLDHIDQSDSIFEFVMLLKHWASGIGLNEVINYSFVGHKDLDILNLEQKNRISIKNPLSAEQDVLRTCLVPGLLHSVRNNLAQGAQQLRIFEIANVFEHDENSETTAKETCKLGITLYGSENNKDYDYAEIRGLLEHLLKHLHLSECEFVQINEHPYLLPCINLMLQGDVVGFVGRIKPDIGEKYHAKKSIWVAEVNLNILKEKVKNTKIIFVPLTMYPCIQRDITVIGDVNLKVGQILDCVKNMKLPLLEEINYLYGFSPDNCDEKHLTFRLIFRHFERTLRDEEVDKEREKVIKSLEKSLKVRI